MNRPKHNRWLLTLFLVCAIILSLPLPKANAQNFVNNRFNVVVVLDASGSMKNTDPNGLRYEAISQFFGLLAEQGNALGGVVFHTELAAEETLTEITDQSGKDTVMDMLKSIPSNGGWTNTGAGLARAVEMIKQDGAADLPSVILFLSDGNTAMASKEETQASLDQKAEALQAAREQGIQIYSVCLNANKGADVSEMQQLADATGGVFREVTKAEDLQDVFNTFYDLIYGTSTITISVYPELFARIIISCLCGAIIGYERSKRMKAAGIRTHSLIAITAVLSMIVSKYSFADLTPSIGGLSDSIRSADPSRIAAQVISGVSFLGTGVIFVKRGNPLGLTTAAGIWATAAVGLAIGSGLYILGIFTMLLVLSLQFMLHKFSVGDDAFAMRDILLSGKNETDISNTINRLLTEKGIQIVESKFSRSEDNDLLCHLSVRVGSEYTHKEALKMLQDYPEIKSISA